MQEGQAPGRTPSQPWCGRQYLGMITVGLALAVYMRMLPPEPHAGVTIAALFGLATGSGLVVRCAMRYSMPPEELEWTPLDLRGLLKEMPVALAVFALYLGLTVAALRASVPA